LSSAVFAPTTPFAIPLSPVSEEADSVTAAESVAEGRTVMDFDLVLIDKHPLVKANATVPLSSAVFAPTTPFAIPLSPVSEEADSVTEAESVAEGRTAMDLVYNVFVSGGLMVRSLLDNIFVG
jgi:hypothetical protein